MRKTRKNHLIFRQGRRVLPNEADSKLDEAKSYVIDGDLNKALELLDEYLLNFPLNASAWNLKGMIYLQNGSFDLAKESLSQAINISPDDERLYYNMRLTSFYEADLIPAEEYFNRSMSGNFQIPEQYFYLGLTQYGLAKYDTAIESFNRSIELNPKDPALWLNLGTTYEKIKRFDKAIFAYNEANTLDPNYAKPYFLKGKIFIDYGNSTNAMDSFRNYTRLEPSDDNGWFWYANSLRKTNDKNESLTALNRAIALNPENTAYKDYLRMYDYGNYSGIIYDNTVTPLPFHIVMLSFIVIIIFSIIAIVRR